MLALTGLAGLPGLYIPVFPPGPAALALFYLVPAAGLWFITACAPSQPRLRVFRVQPRPLLLSR